MKNQWAELQIGLPTGQGVATYPAGATFGPRIMRDWEFVWILEGDAHYSRRDENGEQTVVAPAGSVVLCRPHATDSFVWDAHKRTRHAFFHFRIESLPVLWSNSATWPFVRLPERDDLLRPLFRHVLHGAQQLQKAASPNIEYSITRNQSEKRALSLRLSIAHLLTSFVDGDFDMATEFAPENWHDSVERAWSFIHRKAEEASHSEVTLRQIAQAAHITPEHLCRVFKTSTSWTPMQALRLARLDRAAVLLARSNYNVNEIAALYGFASAFHFSRVFKDAFDQAPRDLKRALQNGTTPPVPRLLRQRF